MSDPKLKEIEARLEGARKASRRPKLSDIQDVIAKGKVAVEVTDAMTGNHIPFAKQAEDIAEISITGIGLFAKLKAMFKKKK